MLIPEMMKDLYFIDFVPEEHFNNNQYKVIKRYEGKISDNVQSILSEVLQTQNIGEIEETSEELNFYGNSKKPYYVITNLATKSIPRQETRNCWILVLYDKRWIIFLNQLTPFFKRSSQEVYLQIHW